MQEIINSKNQTKSIPTMDFDIESFEFKPVTKGLGFHQDKIKENSSRKFKRTQTMAQKERVRYEERSVTINSIPTEIKKAPRKEEVKVIAKANNESKEARMGLQFTSFIFDLVLISFIQLALNYSFFKIVQLDSFTKYMQFTWQEQSLFFSFLFLFYFTVLELTSTPGKKIFSMKLETTVGKKLTIDQTLIRSVVTLLSFITAGMPLLFDFQGKLSDTKVTENA